MCAWLSLARVENELPRVTIIVPTKPGQVLIKSVEAARRLDYPHEKIEVIIARGRQPSIQRNRALHEASGEIIYFLDDDAEPTPDALRCAVEHFRDAKVQMVGGPNLCPPGAPFLEQVFAVVLGSWIAFGPSRARYACVGKTRATSEKELILCHLLARRAPVLALAGFDESLYPNEENALMDELQKRGGKLIYDPDVVVYRRPRPTLKSFCKMLMTYGRGRAEQFRLHPSFGSALNFVPPVFVVCLFLIPLWISLGWFGIHCNTKVLGADATVTMSDSSCRFGFAWFPLFAYAFALGVQTMVNCGKGVGLGLCALPLLFATHFFYGLGFWRGVFTGLNCSDRATMEVKLERVTLD